MNAPTIIQRLAHPRMVGRVTPCAPRLTSKRTSFLQPPPSQCFTLKKQIMQEPAFTTCCVRIQSAQAAGRVATGFPLPSTGRGIEGEGWSYPEPPPVRFFLYQPHPGSRLKTLPKIPVISHLSLSTSHEPTPKHPRRNPQSMLSRGEHAPSRVSDRASRSEPMRAIARRYHAPPTSSCPPKLP